MIKSIAELKNPNKSRAGDLYESFSPSQKEKKQQRSKQSSRQGLQGNLGYRFPSIGSVEASLARQGRTKVIAKGEVNEICYLEKN